MRRLLAAWGVFGALLAGNVATIAISPGRWPWEGLLGRAVLGSLAWCLFESFLGPWAKGRRAGPDGSRRTAEVVADYVAAQIRAVEDDDDGDGAVTRRCC
jgi:hypothetical protein